MSEIRRSNFVAEGKPYIKASHRAAEPLGARGRVRAGGFTLIELLVVVGILAILLAILLPTISKVRVAGYDSATTHRVQALMTAIDNYYQANNAYPGPVANSELLAGPSFNQTLPGGAVSATSSENLTLGLMGGLTYAWTASAGGGAPTPTVGYDDKTVGLGPLSGNALQAKRYPAYADPKVCGLESQANGVWLKWSDPGHSPQATHRSLYADTVIPEFTDSFPDAMPILYARANGSGATNVAIPGAPDAVTGKVDSTGKAPSVWDPTQFQPYAFPAVPTSGAAAVSITNDAYSTPPDTAVLADFPGGSDPRQPHYYFAGADHVTPRQKGGYLLIVAGKDRKYMTKDDRINGSPVQ